MIVDHLANSSLLIIDDEDPNLELLEGLLRSEGYRRIVCVADSRRALGAIEECRPDLVLLDLHMPHRNGFEVLAELRNRVDAEDFLPVLVLTADVTPEARDRALSDGAQDFVTKPFDAVEVLLRVRNLLESRHLHRAQRQAREQAEAAARRARLLADASRVLGASLDSETGLTQVATLLVRDFASCCEFLLLEGEADGDTTRLRRVSGCDGGVPSVGADADGRLTEEEVLRAIAEGRPRPIGGSADRRLVVPIIASSRPIGAMVVTLRDPSGTDEIVATLSDLASRTALSMENAALFANAQLASRSRERMLSVVAHDLRNPLAVVTMYAEMLLDLLPPDGDRYAADALTSIFKSSQRMQQQIEDLLDLGRLQQGSFTVRPAECAVDELFSDADLVLRPLATARAIEFAIDADGGASGSVAELDTARFQQVLSNLVGNAIKFTPEGGRVVLGWRVTDSELKVFVADSGMGIPRDKLPHVFGAFWQARDADRRGVGLGLWIARAIVESHGGRIWVDSIEGKGATFAFTMPLRQVPASPTAEDGRGVGRSTHASLPVAEVE